MNLQELHDIYKEAAAALEDVQARYKTKQAELQEQIQQLEARWSESNAELIEELQSQMDLTAGKELLLRDAIKKAYLANPTSKTVAPGLSVRILTKPIYDKEKAFQWAKEHGLALTLDAKAFEKIASVQALDFVDTLETVSAVIGK